MIYLLLFYKPSLRFIRGHVIVNFLSPVNASFRRSEYVVLRLSAQPFLGLIGKVDFPSMVILLCPSRLASYQFGFFNFCKVCFQNLGFLEKYWGLRSILGGYPLNCLSLAFPRGGSEVVDYFFYLFLRKLDGLSRPISSGYLLLSLGCRTSDYSSSGAYVGFCLSCSSLWQQGIKSPRLGLLFDCNWLPGNSAPCLLF